MSQSMTRDKLLYYYRAVWCMEPPKMVVDADPEDVFAWGMTFGVRCGTAALHKAGRVIDGVYYLYGIGACPAKGHTVNKELEAQYKGMEPEPVPMYAGLSSVPLPAEEIKSAKA